MAEVEREKGAPKKTDIEDACALYRKLLAIVTDEKEKIARQDIQGIEHCCSLKTALMEDLAELHKKEHRVSGSDSRAQLEELMRKIIVVNEENAEAVRKMKAGIMDAITSLHKGKAACRVYQSDDR